MCSLKSRISLTTTTLAVISLLMTSGCMNPYYGNRYSYPMTQPAYAPSPVINNAAPGSLIIPESNLPPTAPQGTYDQNPPADDFKRGDDGQFYGTEPGGVPTPRPLNENQFQNELGGSSTQYSPPVENIPGRSGIQQVSGLYDQSEYGFDTRHYRWLRGVLRYDAQAGGWTVTYSLAGRDEFGGSLSLNLASNHQMNGLSEGANVDVHGQIDSSVQDKLGRPVYQVSSISRIDP